MAWGWRLGDSVHVVPNQEIEEPDDQDADDPVQKDAEAFPNEELEEFELPLELIGVPFN